MPTFHSWASIPAFHDLRSWLMLDRPPWRDLLRTFLKARTTNARARNETHDRCYRVSTTRCLSPPPELQFLSHLEIPFHLPAFGSNVRGSIFCPDRSRLGFAHSLKSKRSEASGRVDGRFLTASHPLLAPDVSKRLGRPVCAPVVSQKWNLDRFHFKPIQICCDMSSTYQKPSGFASVVRGHTISARAFRVLFRLG